MKKRTKQTLATLLISLAILISFIGGVNIGFNDGYSYSNYLRCTHNAFFHAISLKNLRENKINNAINLLESELDMAIIEHDVSKKPSLAFKLVSVSHIFDLDCDKDLQHFKKAIEYRKQYPSVSENEDTKNAVHSHLYDIENKLKK